MTFKFLKKICAPVFIALVLTNSVFADEDMYHANLRETLKTNYGIEYGTWVLTDQEISTNKLSQLSSVSKKTEAYSGMEPFTEKLTLTVTTKGANVWDNAVRFLTRSDIEKNDILLLVMWVRGVEGEDGYGRFEHIFEMTTDPYTKDLNIGADPAAVWQQWILPFKASQDYKAGSARYQMNMGTMKQVIEIGGLALINFGTRYTLEEMPRSSFDLDYGGRDLNAPWRAEAQQRIEEFRMAPITVKVVNKNDQPIKNASVEVNMLRHEFGFGTAVAISGMQDNSADGRQYREYLENLSGNGKTFSIVVIENALKWPTWENPWWTGGKDAVADVVAWFADRDIKVRGHNLVWPGWSYLPADIKANQNNPEYISKRIENHIFEIAEYPGINGILAEWDVINEAAHNFDLKNVYGSEAPYIDWFNWAKEADPNAKLYYNEYSIINNGGKDVASQDRFKALTQYLIDNGAPLDGIGIQCHMGLPLTDINKVYQILDEFSVFNKDISITEYDASGINQDELTGDYMRDFLTIVFSHPAVKNFLMWGFWDNRHWFKDAPIFRNDWSLKPSGEQFIDLIFNKWWTNKAGNTDNNGEFKTRGFLGAYEITAQIEGIQDYTPLSLTKDNGTVTIKLNTELTEIEKNSNYPYRFNLEKNYPNPFNPSTVIEYSLAYQTNVTLTVFNVNGQQIAELVNEQQEPGDHSIHFNAAGLPSGIYIYKLSTNSFTKTEKMLLVK